MPVRCLPSAFLTLPSLGDRSLVALTRKVRLLGVRALLTSSAPSVARLQIRLRADLEADGPKTLERIGGLDVLPRLLCLAGNVLPPDRCLEGLPEFLEGRTVVTAPLADGVHLALEDSNPLALVEGHPDKDGNALDLGGRDVGDWVRALREALNVVAAALPEWSEGVRPYALRRIVPVGFDEREHRSASYREAPGLAYLSLHPDPLTMAEAVVHEAQHSALNLLSHFDPLLEDAPDVLVSSPVRPDPRPLRGVLLAAHAFVPVAALHLRLADAHHPLASAGRFADRRREILQTNGEALETLEEYGHPTVLGGRVLAGLRALHDAVSAAADPLP